MTHPPLHLQNLEAELLPVTIKGLPARAAGRPLRELGRLGLSLLAGDLPLPAAILKISAMSHNSDWMMAFAERAGVSVCPHGKTTMAPQLFSQQLRAGCWGMTAATASHVRTYRHFGVQRIILANQLIGRANIELVFDEIEADPDFDFYCLVDSFAGLQALQDALRDRPLTRPLQVLLEVGSVGGRTGVRSLEDGIKLGRAIRNAAPAIVLRGIEAFEGIVGGPDHARIELVVHTMLDTVSALATQGCEEAWFAPGELILTAGGSAFFDMAARLLAAASVDRPRRIVLRSGCYLTHDVLFYERMALRMRERAGPLWGGGPGLRNALEVWAQVQSVPEPRRAICALGKRDISYDMELPRPLWWFRPGLHATSQPVGGALHVSAMNDQHAYIDATVGELDWQVGDLVGFGVGHPCTTFDKWSLLYQVDDDYRVQSGIRTFF